jgi:hypothetical protein
MFRTDVFFVRSRLYEYETWKFITTSRPTLRGGELILKGYDNETIADSVEVTPSVVCRLRSGLCLSICRRIRRG